MFQETKKIKTSIYNTYYYFIWYIIQIFYRILYLKIKNSINFRCNQTFPLKNQQIAISAKKNPLIEPKNSPSLRKQTFVKKKLYFPRPYFNLIRRANSIGAGPPTSPSTPHPHRRSRIQKPNPKPPHNNGKNKRSPWRKASTKTPKKARETKKVYRLRH